MNYQLEILQSDNRFVPVAIGDDPEALRKALPSKRRGHRIIKSDRPRLKNGQLSLRGIRPRRSSDLANHHAQASAYADWLIKNGRTDVHVFPEITGTLARDVRSILQRAGLNLIDVDPADYA